MEGGVSYSAKVVRKFKKKMWLFNDKLYEKLQMLSFRDCVHPTVKNTGSYM